ncbi:helix-turn-helix domain-containing protein [Govanella unica]|uniref:Helix-turn-helix domain-containing protein n=1 Tax=Govanella unica TaxID=2975056 RepID=A0A9X3U0H0_9PROT|nr:helix-turn-helix transcriptional regulator [Govania unica]MDA5195085.1 helix-turn-helix domain-containing protein [Govania unica]
MAKQATIRRGRPPKSAAKTATATKAAPKTTAPKSTTTRKVEPARRRGARQSVYAKRVDAYVGERLRERRSMMGYTQESLANHLKLSHQQVQKYETGANRISAGRLYELAKTLGVNVSYFFDGFDEGAPITEQKHGGTNRSAIEIAQNFSEIKDPSVKSTLSSLVKMLAQHERERQDA